MLSHAEVSEKVNQLSRAPFREQLARLLNCAPTDEAIVALAERSPDRYWQAAAIIARLAGYSDKLEVDANINARVSTMSDAELQAAIAESEVLLSVSYPSDKERTKP